MLIVVLACSVLASCVSGRIAHKTTRRDGVVVTCLEPPPDIVAKSGRANVDAASKEIGRILKGSIDIFTETERVREISKSVNDYEVLDFRMCMNYANEALTPEQYGMYIGQIRGLLQEASHAGPRQSLSPSGVKQPAVPTSSYEPARMTNPAPEAVQPVGSCSDSDPSISCLWR